MTHYSLELINISGWTNVKSEGHVIKDSALSKKKKISHLALLSLSRKKSNILCIKVLQKVSVLHFGVEN